MSLFQKSIEKKFLNDLDTTLMDIMVSLVQQELQLGLRISKEIVDKYRK